MTFLVLKTSSPPPPGSPPQLFLPSSSSSSSFSFSFFNKKNPNPRNSSQQHHYCFFSPEIQILETNGHLESNNNKKEIERGLEFETGDSFFRHESAIGRDLGVLSASLYKESKGNLRVLDALCGCGVRSLRYLVQAKADFVLANDANDAYRGTIVSNLLLSNTNNKAAAAAAAAAGGGVSADSEGGGGGGGEPKKWLVTHSEANRLMTECYLNRDFFDLIDVDSFGSDSSFFRSALGALKIGGLLYITSTDGYTSGGHRPYHGLESYGAYVRPMPYSNEIGLRMLIAGAIRDASVLGYRVSPLFSYYSYHGPVFRVMLQVNKGKSLKNRHYGFISYCHKCGNSQAISWDKLGSMCCPCSKDEMSRPLIVSGPVWTGPLHDTAYVKELLNLAEKWGWAGNGTGMDLEKLLKQMIEESNPELPFGYIKLDEVAKRAKVNSPPLRTMMNSLHEEGYAVSRSHIASNAIKTNCPMKECIRIAQDLQRH